MVSEINLESNYLERDSALNMFGHLLLVVPEVIISILDW